MIRILLLLLFVIPAACATLPLERQDRFRYRCGRPDYIVFAMRHVRPCTLVELDVPDFMPIEELIKTIEAVDEAFRIVEG